MAKTEQTGWDRHEHEQRRAWLQLSYAQRLAWLENAKRFQALAMTARKSNPTITGPR